MSDGIDTAQYIRDSLDALSAAIRTLQDSERSLYRTHHPRRRLPGGQRPRTKRLRKKQDIEVQRFVADFWLKQGQRWRREQRTQLVRESLLSFGAQIERYNAMIDKLRDDLRKQMDDARLSLLS